MQRRRPRGVLKKHGPLSVVQTMQIGLQVAGALQCAQCAGFISRSQAVERVLATDSRAMNTKLIDLRTWSCGAGRGADRSISFVFIARLSVASITFDA